MTMNQKKDSHINILEEAAKHPFPDINKLRTSDEDFIVDLVGVGNLINKFLAVTASLVPDLSIAKLQQGVLLGHIVRMFKLYDSFLLLVSESRSEIALLALRALTETSITLKYLIYNINDDLCQKFIKSSLAYDKKLWDFIQNKIDGREPLSFENRMIESIKKTFADTKYNIDDINFKKDKAWHEDLLTLSCKVGLLDDYETIYRTCSRAEHGSWYHLKFYHLVEGENGFEPELNNISPNPQLIIAANLVCLGAALDYLKYVTPNEKTFLVLIQNLIEWHIKLSNKRDEFLNRSDT